MICLQRGLGEQRVDTISSPAAGPNAMLTATARFSVTTGKGAICASASYSAAMRTQSVSVAVGARELGTGERVLCVELQAQFGVFGCGKFLMAQVIQRSAFGGGHQPRARIIGNARSGPVFERGYQAVLRQFFGQADIARHTRHAGDEFGAFDIPDGFNRLGDIVQKLTMVLKPPQNIRLPSKGMFLPSIIDARRGSAITLALMRSRSLRDL